MNKAFTKETDDDDDDGPDQTPEPTPLTTNYVTPGGFADLQQELLHLVSAERPKVVETVSWAAGNGDRSENGDYIYGKRRLREIDRRIRYLTKRIDNAKIVDPQLQKNLTQVFFGATVTYAQADGKTHTVKIVGVDEANLEQGKISWISPVAKTLIKASVGDQVILRSPGGTETLSILTITYEPDSKSKIS
jgi:transcription elongation factor GreB